MVWRISVAWMTERRSSARVRASRVKPSSRDHSPMYIDGAYCAWMPPMRSSALGSGRAGAFEQQLARQQRPVQLPLREGAHRRLASCQHEGVVRVTVVAARAGPGGARGHGVARDRGCRLPVSVLGARPNVNCGIGERLARCIALRSCSRAPMRH